MNVPPSSSPVVRTPEVDFSIIGTGFNLYLKNWVPFALVYLLFGGIPGAFLALGYISLIGSAIAADSRSGSGLVAGGLGFGALFYGNWLLAVFAMLPVLWSSMTHMAAKLVSNEDVALADATYGFKNHLGTSILVLLLVLVASSAASITFIGGYVVAGFTLFAMPFVIRGELNGISAIKRSIELAAKNWLMVIVFSFVIAILAGLGAFACLVGIFFTYPLYFVWIELLFRQQTGESFGPDQSYAPGPTNYPREFNR
jgi:hypothetical protein